MKRLFLFILLGCLSVNAQFFRQTPYLPGNNIAFTTNAGKITISATGATGGAGGVQSLNILTNGTPLVGAGETNIYATNAAGFLSLIGVDLTAYVPVAGATMTGPLLVTSLTNSALTASRIVLSDANKALSSSSLTEANILTESEASLAYVPLAGATMTGPLYLTALTNNALTASRFVVSDANKALASSGASSVLAATLTDETGTGAAVFANDATLSNLTVNGTLIASNLVINGNGDNGIDAIRVTNTLTAGAIIGTGTNWFSGTSNTFTGDLWNGSTNIAAALASKAASVNGTMSNPTITGSTNNDYVQFEQSTLNISGSSTNFLADFTASPYQLITATNHVTFTNAANVAAGRWMTVVVDANGADRALRIPATWFSRGLASQLVTVTNGTVGIMSLYGYGSDITNVIATYSYATK